MPPPLTDEHDAIGDDRARSHRRATGRINDADNGLRENDRDAADDVAAGLPRLRASRTDDRIDSTLTETGERGAGRCARRTWRGRCSCLARLGRRCRSRARRVCR